MANSWFQFKQFKVQQGSSAMKVGTDGVLLGAWTDVSNCDMVLDIGTGTGLIALMLAQKNAFLQVHAVELDKDASNQAQENFDDSKWKDRLQVINQSIQNYSKNNSNKYDLIVSNPPFYINSYSSDDSQRQMARHTDTLTNDDLIDSVKNLLKETGSFSVILPSDSMDFFIDKSIKSGLFLNKKLNIYPTNKTKIKRVLLSFSFVETGLIEEELIVEPEHRHVYSQEYIELTKDYYLNF